MRYCNKGGKCGAIVLRHSFHAGKTSNLSPDKSPLVNENGTINSLMTQSIALRSVAAQINEYFTSIAQEFKPLLQVQSPPNVISSDLLVSPEEVLSDSCCKHRRLSDQKEFQINCPPSGY